MPPRVVKRKKSYMTLDRKREILEKMEAGVSVGAIMAQFDVPKSTLYDLRKAAGSVKQFHDNFGKERSVQAARPHGKHQTQA